MAAFQDFDRMLRRLKTIQNHSKKVADTLYEHCNECDTSMKSSIESELIAISSNIEKALSTLGVSSVVNTSVTVNDVVEIMDEIETESKNDDKIKNKVNLVKHKPLYLLNKNKATVEKPVCLILFRVLHFQSTFLKT